MNPVFVTVIVIVGVLLKRGIVSTVLLTTMVSSLVARFVVLSVFYSNLSLTIPLRVGITS